MASCSSFSVGRKGLAMACLIVFASISSSCSGTGESEFERLVRETGCTTADAVYRDYQRNEVAAQQKYQGRVNRVCGIVDEIELNIINEPLISLRASQWGSVSIGGVDSASAGRMAKGSPAVFDCGGINELLGNPVLMQCSTIENPVVDDLNKPIRESLNLNKKEEYPANECIGYYVYIPENTELESGFSIKIGDRSIKMQYSDQVNMSGEKVVSGNGNIYFEPEYNGKFTIYCKNGAIELEFPPSWQKQKLNLPKSKGDIFSEYDRRGISYGD